MRYASMQTALCAVIIALFLILTEYADSRKEKVEEMADLIDREAAIEAVKHAWAKGIEPSQYIEIIPAADVNKVRDSIWLCVETDDEQFFLCKDCKHKEYWESNYCPNCGAKME